VTGGRPRATCGLQAASGALEILRNIQALRVCHLDLFSILGVRERVFCKTLETLVRLS
jgi:hypothetical protein